MKKLPVICGKYINIYKPGADIYPGPDSLCFKKDTEYTDWVPNDHAVVRGYDGKWHALGITHPAPPDYIFLSEFNPDTIHDAEWLLFHAETGAGALKDNLTEGAWEEKPKALYPAQRPGEANEIYAPYITAKDGIYYMFYGPNPMRLAVSSDLYSWKPEGPLFYGHPSIRDPNILEHNGEYLLTYVDENKLMLRKSADLRVWSDAEEIFRTEGSGVPESPSLIYYEGMFYLFWCIYDGTEGPYDHRTYVYCSEDPYNFKDSPLLTEIDAHAPEIIRDEDGSWYITSVEWPHRGLSIARLSWKDKDTGK